MNALLEKIALVCLNSLWIGFVLCLLLRLLLSVIPDSKSALRYRASYLGLLLIFPLSFAAQSLPSVLPAIKLPINAAPGIAIIWGTGFSIFLCKIAFDFLSIMQLRWSSTPLETGEIANCFSAVKSDTGTGSHVRLLSSPRTEGPIMIGSIFPAVVIPTSWLTGVPLDHLRAVFAHELGHACRFDFAANILQRILEAALFFNPAALWIGRLIREEREHACDDFATTSLCSPIDYSRALVWFQSFRDGRTTSPLAPALGKPEELPHRIHRLIRNSHHQNGQSHIGLLTTIALAVLSTASLSVFVGGTSLLAKGDRELSKAMLHRENASPFTELVIDDHPRPLDPDTFVDSNAKWEAAEPPLFTSITIIKKGDLAIDIRKDDPRLFPELPNRYLLDQGLPFLDATLPYRDLDDDGFHVLEEYQAGTDPKSAESHPAYANKLKFIKRQAQVYTIKFSARPDSKRFQLQRIPTAKWPQRASFYLKIGETSEDQQIRIDAFAEKEAKRNEIIIDASQIQITHLPTGKKATLVRNIEEHIPTYFAEFQPSHLSKKSFYVKEGEEFAVPGDEEKWTLKSVGENECVITRKSGDKVMSKTIVKEK